MTIVPPSPPNLNLISFVVGYESSLLSNFEFKFKYSTHITINLVRHSQSRTNSFSLSPASTRMQANVVNGSANIRY